MRRLILMRHAKSEPAEAGQSDHERPLNARGRDDASRVARWFAECDLIPEIILASSANRVRQTADQLVARWAVPPPVFHSDALYLAPPETILRVVRGDAIDHTTVMVLAHNPGLEMLASLISGQQTALPTAAVAAFEFEIDDWRDLASTRVGRPIASTRPKTIDQ